MLEIFSAIYGEPAQITSEFCLTQPKTFHWDVEGMSKILCTDELLGLGAIFSLPSKNTEAELKNSLH